ncbi:hypothetical protein RGQ29_004134 [Quercus rubra]|uniref:RING-type E3 ubiquitin transferase n=1 Tax=Quercus rubra TaxID=3512 RepID=A0AAN7I8H3_QUERU|nr:hypothetical protein RGQ29_004134 [Quercus rubra]
MNFEKSGGATVPPGSSTLASPVRVTEDSIYVAVGRDVMSCKSILIWAIQHSEANRICILYVHQPAKWQIMSVIKRGHRETERERQRIDNVLEKYCCICRDHKVQANSVHIEKDSIKRGIVALITQHGIRNLVMGAAADKHYKEDMKAPMSRKAVYVNALAPPSCRIRFICRGNLIDTREAHNVTGHSTVNNGRSIKDITPSSSSRFLTEGYSSDESEGSSRTSFLISSCSSPYKTMLSPSWGNENGSELSALSPASGYSKSPLASPLMQPSLMLPSSGRCLDGTFYGELQETRANIEKGTNLSLKAERENSEKALRMVSF